MNNQIYTPETEEEAPVEITLEQLEDSRKQCKDIIETSEAAIRLSKNEDFIKVMFKTYFEEEPKRLGYLIASGKLPDSSVDGAIENLKAVGIVQKFLNDIVMQGNLAKDSLNSLEEAYNNSLESK